MSHHSTLGPHILFSITLAGLFFSCPSRLTAQATALAPAKLTALEDRERMLQLLGIKQLRDPVSVVAGSPQGANYDESKANPYPHLPDPLRRNNGQRVTTAQQWWNERRPEIVELFDREIYGRPPAGLPKVSWEVVSATPEKIGGRPVVTKKLVGHVDNTSYPQITVNIELLLTTPADANSPVPVVMELAFSKEFSAVLAKQIPDLAVTQGPTWQQQVLEKGWGYAVLSPTSYQADDGASLTSGIIGLMNKGQPRKPDDWGVLRAWAWGASRALDYFETDKSVDAAHVAIEGHSRNGKAALVAMACDPRFAVGYISSSGEGGAKLYRHIFGEQIANLASPTEYHWMAGNFLKYAGPLTPADLPVDNHELIALVAPRPVFIGAGSSAGDGYANPKGDAWADARGMFLAEVAAGPVYRLLGKKGLGTDLFPPIETALISGDLAFRQHSGGHNPAPNWPAFLTFAGRYLHASESLPRR